MSTTDNENTGTGLFKSNWHRTPNAMIDLVMGASISANAGWVVMTVIRYTEGMNGKKSAAIPTATFKRVLGTKRDNTAYPYIREAEKAGLITVSRKNGCVSTYSINEKCDLWSKTIPLSESATSSDKRLSPVAESDSTPISESDTRPLSESATLIKKDISKDFLKEQNEQENFDRSYEVIKNQLKMAGIIPIGKPVNDEELRPEVYKFVTWCNEKEIADLQRTRAVVKWFQGIDSEERKRYYTQPADHSQRYFNADDYEESIPVTDDEAAEIRARYAGVFF
ncbi:MAG: hypothetical protein ACTH7L_13810 [Psychrobacter alimentarius]